LLPIKNIKLQGDKMNKKKILATLSSLVLVAFFAGCGLTSPETPETPEETPAETPAEGEEEPAEEPSSDMPEVTLVYAEVNPLDTIVGQTDTAI